MYKKIPRDKQGKIVDAVPSSYSPSKKVKDVTSMVMKDIDLGRRILTQSYPEFNDRSVIGEVNANQKAFNSYIPPRSDDPDESWRAQTVRPITRNKLISIAAHVVASILYPGVFAQNQRDQEDKDAAIVMRDLIEWVITNSNYERTFLQAIIAALTDPAAIIHTGFYEVMRKVKEMKEDGTYSEREILDEVLSGFAFYLVPCSELYIANIFEADIQRQRFVARRKLIEYDDAQLIYAKHNNFKYVKPGVRAVFSKEENTFYEISDTDLGDSLVEEVVYYNRAQDLELTFINGILMCAPDYPNQRQDKMYPFAKFGYELLNNGLFFYYKSAANKLGSDQELVDTMYNMVIDGTFLSLMPPSALYGSENVDASVYVPGTITSFRDPNTKFESIGPKSDLRAGLEGIGLIEKSMTESSQDNSQAGIGDNTERTAYEIGRLEQNAKTALGLFGKNVGFFVSDLGQLLLSDICQHLTVAQVMDITTPGGRMQFKSFVLPDKVEAGRKVTKRIKFTDQYFNDDEYSKEKLMDNSTKILEEEGDLDAETKIYMVDPQLFREMKYKITIEPDILTPRNKNLEKALNLEAYDRLVQNPLVDMDAITREFLLDVYKPGESDRYMSKGQPQTEEDPASKTGMKPKGVNNNLTGQITGSSSLRMLNANGGQ